LEKLLDARSFGGSFDHPTHCYTIFLVFLGQLNFISMVWITTPTFLGCWALIVLALITHFPHEDCFILLDVVVQVETSTSPFQMALQDVQTMLPHVVRS
jgi:hypothetical protein